MLRPPSISAGRFGQRSSLLTGLPTIRLRQRRFAFRSGGGGAGREGVDDSSSSQSSSSSGPSSSGSEPASMDFELAAQRLDVLLQGVSSDSVLEEVEGYDPDERLTLLANIGSFTSVAAFAACWLANEDPLGGLTLTESSLHAAVLGIAFGLPLIACSAAGHSARAKAAFPVLDELHAAQRQLIAPLVADMSLGQLGMLVGFAVLPALLFFLPGFKSGIDALAAALSFELLTPRPLLGAAVPGGAAAAAAAVAPRLPPVAAALLPSVLSAYTAGYVVAALLGVRRQQIAAISDALGSAERYFRLSISQARGNAAAAAAAAPQSAPPAADKAAPAEVTEGGEAAACSDARGRSAAAAFKTVAGLWLLTRYQVSRLSFVLASLNICYLYIIWETTDDLATPFAAALLHMAAEVAFSLAEQREEEESLRARLEARAAAAGWPEERARRGRR